jgi:hypothetical protein
MTPILLLALAAAPTPGVDQVDVPESVATQAFEEWRRAGGRALPAVAVDRVTNDDAIVIVRQEDGTYLAVRVDMDRAKGTSTVTTAPATPPAPDDARVTPFLGRYKGQSLCLANKPVCKDEVVVYTFSRAWGRARPVRWQADKIVDGVQELMGTMDCAADGRTLTCPMAGGTWTLTFAGDRLEGGGTWKGARVRAVSATRER